MDSHVPNNQTGSWTNEKHVQFLKTMEASFVRAMFENNAGTGILRLDRTLPDSSESTLDLKKHRRKKHATPGYGMSNMGPRSRMDGRTEKRTRKKISSRPCNSSQDQVVPQLENRIGCDDKDERDPSNVAVTPVS